MSERNATYVAGMGVGAGSIGSVSAVAGLGVPGLGATGITSGLAAIGNIVGGWYGCRFGGDCGCSSCNRRFGIWGLQMV